MTVARDVAGRDDDMDIPSDPTQETTVNAASADDTGVLAVPAASTIDPDLRQDITSAAWMMAVVTVPGLAALALLV